MEVGSQCRSKIDQKTISTWEGILASIFYRFLVDDGKHAFGMIEVALISEWMIGGVQRGTVIQAPGFAIDSGEFWGRLAGLDVTRRPQTRLIFWFLFWIP